MDDEALAAFLNMPLLELPPSLPLPSLFSLEDHNLICSPCCHVVPSVLVQLQLCCFVALLLCCLHFVAACHVSATSSLHVCV
jgi:hypothetical protein